MHEPIQSLYQSINQSIHQSINQSINQLSNQSINQSINQASKQASKQTSNQASKQAIDQSLMHSFIQTKFDQSTYAIQSIVDAFLYSNQIRSPDCRDRNSAKMAISVIQSIVNAFLHSNVHPDPSIIHHILLSLIIVCTSILPCPTVLRLPPKLSPSTIN